MKKYNASRYSTGYILVLAQWSCAKSSERSHEGSSEFHLRCVVHFGTLITLMFRVIDGRSLRKHTRENKYRSNLIKIHVQFARLAQLHNIWVSPGYAGYPSKRSPRQLGLSLSFSRDGTTEGKNLRRFYI